MNSNKEVKKLIDLVNFENNKRIPLKDSDRKKRSGIYPYYGASGIIDSIDDFIFDGEYLLISEDGENLKTRKTPIAFKACGKFWVNNHAHILSEKEIGTLDYLKYYFSQFSVLPYITGAAQPKLSKKNLEIIEIPFPNKITRLKINAILNSLTRKIELNKKINQTLESIAQTIFKSWFVDFDPVHAKANASSEDEYDTIAKELGISREILDLFPSEFEESDQGLIPKGWKINNLSNYITVVKGKSYKSSELQPSTTALVTLKSFHRGGGYRLDGLKPYTGKYKAEQLVKPGELIIAYTDVTQNADVIGKPAVIIKNSNIENLVASLDVGIIRIIKNHFQQGYLYNYFKTDLFQNYILGYTSGTTVLHLSKNWLIDHMILTPPSQIIDRFEKLSTHFFQMIDANFQEIEILEKSKNELLPKLLSGEIDVQNLNLEPTHD
ncbi:TPA: restriction endonuclease subunit S [Legionella pneumophila]|uniref:restriction endonuclease subunit S n=1 Tax=Legionella longbeachae TaxID=450 RepID=UPI0001BEBEA2|nr:restriction endonuclease subunit S [Legionella longbeachae]EEZ95984.1 putative type I restriction-modification system S subunit [Legionella longbeachae D-4968]HEO1516599.1 restriction endonuclease subunit S [Legionella pneumophila]